MGKTKMLTTREEGHRRPWRIVRCKFCGREIETRAKWHIKCPECERVTWIERRVLA